MMRQRARPARDITHANPRYDRPLPVVAVVDIATATAFFSRAT